MAKAIIYLHLFNEYCIVNFKNSSSSKCHFGKDFLHTKEVWLGVRAICSFLAGCQSHGKMACISNNKSEKILALMHKAHTGQLEMQTFSHCGPVTDWWCSPAERTTPHVLHSKQLWWVVNLVHYMFFMKLFDWLMLAAWLREHHNFVVHYISSRGRGR